MFLASDGRPEYVAIERGTGYAETGSDLGNRHVGGFERARMVLISLATALLGGLPCAHERNGANKDPAWNDRNEPEEVREKWVEMMNRAMEQAGHEQRLDAHSWAHQGREDLAALREPKLLGGEDRESVELRDRVEELRRQRDEQISILDKLIEKARELATEVKERTVSVAQNVADRVQQLRGRFELWREQQTEAKSSSS